MSIENQKRRGMINEYIQSRPNTTQEDIKDHVNKQGVHTSQATIARDLKELGYNKVDGKYIKQKEKVKSEQESILQKLISHDYPRIIGSSVEVFQIVLSTKRGMEQSIAELIAQVYSENIVGTLVGNGCVIIITTSQKNVKKIRLRLQSYKKTT